MRDSYGNGFTSGGVGEGVGSWEKGVGRVRKRGRGKGEREKIRRKKGEKGEGEGKKGGRRGTCTPTLLLRVPVFRT